MDHYFFLLFLAAFLAFFLAGIAITSFRWILEGRDMTFSVCASSLQERQSGCGKLLQLHCQLWAQDRQRNSRIIRWRARMAGAPPHAARPLARQSQGAELLEHQVLEVAARV